MKRKGTALLSALLAGKVSMFAQVVTGDRFIKEVESSISMSGPQIIRILNLIVLIGGAVWLAIILFNSNEKNGQHKNDLVVWFITVAIILLGLQIINSFIN